MLSVKELFFTLGVVNSFTLSVVGLSVDVPSVTPPRPSLASPSLTKTESINFNKKFQLKHIDRPR